VANTRDQERASIGEEERWQHADMPTPTQQRGSSHAGGAITYCFLDSWDSECLEFVEFVEWKHHQWRKAVRKPATSFDQPQHRQRENKERTGFFSAVDKSSFRRPTPMLFCQLH